ncbi:MAG: tRNA uridine-5-carboxymethylaminomethyl(34) synthesis GTPase MnmE [Eubacterium sp.]|nr:tRNA uridine-5-carboxymethylaminomethyl(34) synthesis GTPase MnmE [Eubacterium sp.]
MNNETIAAIATALSPGGIGIVRISGKDAIGVISKIYRSSSGAGSPGNWESHTIHYGFICDREEIIDEVMVLFMKGPKSYTTEDVVEIDCHGGVVVTRRVLECVLSHGARLAEPGEFTKRAFLNGRIDLSRAEAVTDLIDAGNTFAARSSMSQMRGSVYNKVLSLREKILHQTAFIEAALDDPEHYSLEGTSDQLLEDVRYVLDETKTLIDNSENGRKLKEGIHTVILGKPNAGKSSLLNALAGRQRAIVTDIAGTTRDTIEEEITMNGFSLNMIDTAGIRDAEDPIEKIGVDRAREEGLSADLILYVVDSSIPLDDNDRYILDMIRDRKAIILLNKSDLEPVVDETDFHEITDQPIISISAKEDTGTDELRETIDRMFSRGDISFNDQVIVTNVRQTEELRSAARSLELVIEGVEMGCSEDLLTVDLMDAYGAFGRIIGEEVDEDLIDKIFEDFCMGK